MDFLSLTMKRALVREFFTVLDFLKAASKHPEFARPSSRKHVIVILLILQNFTRHFVTFINTNGADVNSRRRTVN